MRRIVKRLVGWMRGYHRPPTVPPVDFDYKEYWDERYRSGGDSGTGSYGDLADFKADYIHAFLAKHPVQTVLEFGCGDGNQLRLMRYPRYLGLDVSAAAVERCAKIFRDDPTKRFLVYTPGSLTNLPPADLVLCLDVLYHITDEEEFRTTLRDIFASAAKYVILYTSLEKPPGDEPVHIRHRDIRRALLEFPAFSERDVARFPRPEFSSASFILLERNEPAAAAGPGALQK